MKFQYKNSSLVSDSKINSSIDALSEYISKLQSVAKDNDFIAPESSINLAFDESMINKVKELKNKLVNKNLKYIVDIGIGGSNLGTKAVYDALYGYFDVLEPDRLPKVFFADTVDKEYLSKLINFLIKNATSSDEILICMVSKSGGTAETVTNFEIIFKHLSEKFEDLYKRVVVISDLNSKLYDAGIKNKMEVLAIPKMVGGRYSVLSAVGLFPLCALGMDIDKLLEGAKGMRNNCVTNNIFKNYALSSAITLYESYKSGFVINDNFIFHEELESLGKWYRQLMGESIGKEKDIEGKIVNVGITPTVSIGSTDLHSVGQLDLGGPKNKLTSFIYVNSDESNLVTPKKFVLQDLVENIENIPTSKVLDAILEGVKIAYTKHNLPFVEIILDDISEYSIGEFLQFKMLEIMYLGKLLNVNTFDQPSVESYKIETKQILSK